MAASGEVTFEDYQEDDENYGDSEGSDPGYDSDLDPSYSILEDTKANFSNLSIRKKSKSRVGDDFDGGVDENEEEIVQQIIEAGQVEKLKVEQCKVYLRKNGLRLTGNKCTLTQRIKEHLEISNGEGEKKYPVSSFVLNCKGDACTGDVVMFEQNVYEMFNLASRSATGPPCGKRIVAGRIVKESYGAGKQQHTFTIEVLWSKGEKPLSPLHQLLIKGRNLYRLKTLRQRWDDEGERLKVLMEKHSRGSLARSDREKRIQDKEKRKMLKANRMSINEDPKRIQSQMNLKAPEVGTLFQQPDLCVDMNRMAFRPQRPAVQPQQIGLIVDSRKPAAAQSQVSVDPRNLALGPQFAFSSGNLSSKFEELKVKMPNDDQKQLPQRPFMEMQHPSDDIIFRAERTIHRQPNLDMISHQSAAHKCPNTDRMSSFSERTSHREPLKGINHFCPVSPPHRHGHMKQQLCRYYAQGRCYFGDNCKFLHERR